MKTIILISLMFILSNCKGKEKTKSEIKVENYIQSKTENYKKFELKKISEFNRGRGYEDEDKICIKIADSLGIDKSFYEVDFDNNGLLDYLVIGDNHNCSGDNNTSCDFSSMVLMKFPKDSVKSFHLIKSHSGCIVPKIVRNGSTNLLEIYNQKRGVWSEKGNNIEKNTLIYKFDEFIDFNKNPIKQNIEKIEYSAAGCYGTCPVFELTINKNKSSVFIAKQYNFGTVEERRKQISNNKDEGIFKTEIKEQNFNEIINLLEYMNFEALENKYSVNWTDDQRSFLKITYNNGKVKIIEDYGLIGTYSLKKLYQLLFNLRKNQNWK